MDFREAMRGLQKAVNFASVSVGIWSLTLRRTRKTNEMCGVLSLKQSPKRKQITHRQNGKEKEVGVAPYCLIILPAPILQEKEGNIFESFLLPCLTVLYVALSWSFTTHHTFKIWNQQYKDTFFIYLHVFRLIFTF